MKGYAFEFGEPAYSRILADVAPAFNFEIVSPFKKDSQEMTEADRRKVRNLCAKAKQSKIVITHGTDTMIETSQVLGKCLKLKDKCIVITGAMRPERFSNSDAKFNLGVAIGVLSVR